MAKVAWGSSSARLTRDSFLPFASCWLCLEPAIDPVSCAQGDIFCRECALSNILAQKKEIKRTEKFREQEEREALEDQARRDAEAHSRAIKEFESTQAGFSIKSSSRESKPQTTQSPTDNAVEPLENSNGEGGDTLKKGEKRKFSLDDDELARIASEERAKARKAIDSEKVGAGVLDLLSERKLTRTRLPNQHCRPSGHPR